MISIPNTTIELPNYAERETLERLSKPVVITENRRRMGLKCCAKLREIINGTVKVNVNSITDIEIIGNKANAINRIDTKPLNKALTNKKEALVNEIENMTPAKRQEYSL
jgi:hypothetical protein